MYYFYLYLFIFIFLYFLPFSLFSMQIGVEIVRYPLSGALFLSQGGAFEVTTILTYLSLRLIIIFSTYHLKLSLFLCNLIPRVVAGPCTEWTLLYKISLMFFVKYQIFPHHFSLKLLYFVVIVYVVFIFYLWVMKVYLLPYLILFYWSWLVCFNIEYFMNLNSLHCKIYVV